MADIPTRLSMLWAFVMLNILAADVISFLDRTFLEQLLSGNAGGIEITPAFQLLAAAFLEIPIAMIVLSRLLPAHWNRRANIAAAVVTAAFIVGGGSLAPHYVFFAGIEIVALGVIGWSAWTLTRPTVAEPRQVVGAA
jgi:uncharacterized protein DUF6326